MPISEYEDFDAVELGEMIGAGEVTAAEVLEEAISRMEALNPKLNVMVEPLFDAARRVAKASLPPGPLAGVPYLMKNLGLMMEGVRCTQGSALFSDFSSDHDSDFVKRVKSSGLNVFGTTNSPEFGLNSTTEPAAHGPTKNPWNTDYSPGGSSGGSAAAVAARILPAAHASDGGGSIRIPGSNCGLVGLKVSRGRTPSGPDAGEGWAGLSNEHAVTRTVRDSAALLDATNGPAPGDPYFAKAPARDYLNEVGENPGKLRVGLMLAPPDGRAVDPEVVAATQAAAKLMESLGHRVEEAAPDFDINAMFDAVRVVIAGNVGRDVKMRLKALGRDYQQGDTEEISRAWGEEGEKYTAENFADALWTIHDVGRRFGEFFGKHTVLLSPTLAKVPLKLGARPMDNADLDAYYEFQGQVIPFTAPCNVAGVPAITLPLGWSKDDMPIGVQLVAASGNEALLLRLASQIEDAAPWIDKKPGILG
jgi:amidase/6-aminohexanoate-cyclic-dimer hydrolase